MANPIDIIKDDHRKIERLFKEYEDLAEDAFETKEKLVGKLAHELKLHMEMEERLFYPMLKNAFAHTDDKIIEESYVEHEVARRLLEELSVTHSEDAQFDARVKVLNETMTHHVLEEEQEILPRSESKLSKEDMESIGKEIKRFKQEVVDEKR